MRLTDLDQTVAYPDMTDDVVALLDAEPIERVTIVGHSWMVIARTPLPFPYKASRGPANPAVGDLTNGLDVHPVARLHREDLIAALIGLSRVRPKPLYTLVQQLAREVVVAPDGSPCQPIFGFRHSTPCSIRRRVAR
jgi:hypothetical protein